MLCLSHKCTHSNATARTQTRTCALTDTHTHTNAPSGRMDRLPACLPPQSSCLIMHAEAVVLGRWSRRARARAHTSHPGATRSHSADTTVIKSEARTCTCRSSGARRQPSKRRSEITRVCGACSPPSPPSPALRHPHPTPLRLLSLSSLARLPASLFNRAPPPPPPHLAPNQRSLLPNYGLFNKEAGSLCDLPPRSALCPFLWIRGLLERAASGRRMDGRAVLLLLHRLPSLRPPFPSSPPFSPPPRRLLPLPLLHRLLSFFPSSISFSFPHRAMSPFCSCSHSSSFPLPFNSSSSCSSSSPPKPGPGSHPRERRREAGRRRYLF